MHHLHPEYLGILAVTLMVLFYALEQRHPIYILLFAGACALAAGYAWLIQSYPFFVAEGIWAAIALYRWRHITSQDQHHPDGTKP